MILCEHSLKNMNKTISMTIGGMVFYIDEAAYATLDGYLTNIKAHFASYAEREEIIDDIERRLAELFTAKISPAKQALDAQDVASVIQTMGYPEQIDSGEQPTTTAQSSTVSNVKRLYRNGDDRVLCGVCSGFASYFGVDPFILRSVLLIFFVAGLFSAAIPSLFLALVYIGLCVIIPEATTPSQKVEMQGEAVNVSNITEKVKQEAEHIAKQHEGTVNRLKQVTGDVFSMAIQVLRRLFVIVFRVLRVVIGVLLSVAFTIGLMGLTFAASVLLFNVHSPYVDPFIQQFANGPAYVVGVFSLFLLLALPCLVLLLGGLSVVRRKNILNAPTVFTIAGVWMISAIAFGVIAIDRAPMIEEAVQKQEAERIVSHTSFPVSTFHALDADGMYQLTIVPSSTASVVAEGDERDLQSLQARVEAGTLQIWQTHGPRVCFLCFRHPIQIVVSSPNVMDEIRLGGLVQMTQKDFRSKGAKIDVRDMAQLSLEGQVESLELSTHDAAQFHGDEFMTRNAKVLLEDVSRANFFVESTSSTANTLQLTMKDASKLQLAGSVSMAGISLRDVSRLNALNLYMTTSNILLQDAAYAEVTVDGSLTGSVRDVSRLRYAGSATAVDVTTHDAAHVEKY
jgi:phage shock protein PspC (stress-responsive transcriptional regulator)